MLFTYTYQTNHLTFLSSNQSAYPLKLGSNILKLSRSISLFVHSFFTCDLFIRKIYLHLRICALKFESIAMILLTVIDIKNSESLLLVLPHYFLIII